MNIIHSQRRPHIQSAKGVAMIEVLIGMLMIALWLMSSAGLQASSLKFQKSASARMAAMTLATELSERMEANLVGARAGDYNFTYAAGSPPSASTNCASIACTPAQLAAYDLNQWNSGLEQALILQAATVVPTTVAGVTTYKITLTWEESRGQQKYDNDAMGTTKTERMTYTIDKVIRNG